MFSRLTSLRHIWDNFVWKIKCPPSMSVLCKTAAVLLISSWHVSISIYYASVNFLCLRGKTARIITWLWCFCFRLSFPDKVRKAVQPFHLCLTLKLDIRVSVLGSWGPKLCSLRLLVELFSLLPAGLSFMPDPSFYVRQFQESKLHYSQK